MQTMDDHLETGANVAVMNKTGLPDEQVRQVVSEKWLDIVESAALSAGPGGGSFSTRQTAPAGLFVRQSWVPPDDIIEEMELAMRLVDEDDDVANTIGMMSATAFQGMKNLHPDADTVRFFNAAAAHMNLDHRFRELYESLITTNNVYMLKVFQSVQVPQPKKAGRNPSIIMPQITYLNPLSIRVVSAGTLGEPVLVQDVDQLTAGMLEARDNPGISATDQRELLQLNPVAMQLYTEKFEQNAVTQEDDLLQGLQNPYILNPNMVTRYTLTTRPWASKYGPVPLRRAFGLAEAKRLLNLMDYALLNGGINFLIVAKKGSDNLPAQQAEINNLQGIVQQSARTGVMVGDHRLELEILMPSMEALLDPSKRNLLGRKISKSLLRLPDFEFGRIEGGGTPEAEIVGSNIMSDRHLIKRMIEGDLYNEIALRNSGVFKQGTPRLWFPPVTLSGDKFFVDYVLKLRDRGDIPRSWAVEAAGYDSEAAMAERQREVDAGFDEIMTAQNVPNSGDTSDSTGRPRREDVEDDLDPGTGDDKPIGE